MKYKYVWHNMEDLGMHRISSQKFIKNMSAQRPFIINVSKMFL